MEDIVHGIRVDYSRDNLFDELGIKRLKESYMKDEEVSPQERFAFVSRAFGSDNEHAQRLYDYSSRHWLSMLGGGIGIGLGIRSADDKSTGIMPHLRTYDASSLAYRQGRTRRGSYATYLDISHPDILIFLEMRKPTGDQNMRCLNLHQGINITDDFMQLIEKSMLDPHADDTWELKDPHSGVVRDTIPARELWQRILEARMLTGEPYLHFIDTSNRDMHQFQKDLGLTIRQSNLCSEIILPTDKERTAVCCLSSVNLEYYDEWKNDALFLKDIAEMLDNVLEYFIVNAPDTISRAKYSASRERSIGIGALGFHAFLQKSNIAFEGVMAKVMNNQMFKHIKGKLDEANLQLGSERGSPPDCDGTGRRFAHVMAIAPNASSSIIMGNTSPSIEPYRANAYRQDTLSGSSLTKNKWLDRVIQNHLAGDGETISTNDYNDIWSSIIANDGSVQHLSWMDENTKEVFKTSMEIDQRWVVEHAADRQHYIDQAQSLNLFFRPDVNVKYLHACHFLAWKKGLKTLYYCRSEKLAKADKVSKRIERDVIKELDMTQIAQGNECLACEG